VRDAQPAAEINRMFKDSDENCGARKVWQQLCRITALPLQPVPQPVRPRPGCSMTAAAAQLDVREWHSQPRPLGHGIFGQLLS
jgi:hypothetical protein